MGMVNILITKDGIPDKIHSFSNDTMGIERAELLFQRLIREHGPADDAAKEFYKKLDAALEDGCWESSDSDIAIWLIHSEGESKNSPNHQE